MIKKYGVLIKPSREGAKIPGRTMRKHYKKVARQHAKWPETKASSAKLMKLMRGKRSK